MSKSKETFNKKEKEKARQKKQQEKAQKKEERKSVQKKGKSLEEMMAWVDADGNLVTSPPDPSEKKTFSAEDIQISTPKFVEADADEKHSGVVSRYNDEKGYGFIRDQVKQQDVFFHINQVVGGQIKERDRVTFKTERGPKGISAVNVRISN